jgi:hypothetical protein
MKKLLFGLIAIVMFGAESIAQNSVKVVVSCTIQIGRNSTGDCSRFGLCTEKTKVVIKIDVPAYINSRTMPGSFDRSGLLDADFKCVIANIDSKLIMYIDKDNMDAIKNYIKSDTFPIEEDYVFNDESTGLRNHVSKAGIYKFNYDQLQKVYYLSL